MKINTSEQQRTLNAPRHVSTEAGPRADHDRAGPEYRYLDWYATANTDYSRLDQLSRLTHEFSFFIIHKKITFLLGRHGGDYGTKDIQVLHYRIWPCRRILNGACISISNLPEIIAWQTRKDDLRPEARGPLKSRAWGGRPTCHPQTPAMRTYIPNSVTHRLKSTNS
jgi:hypothetical protein